MTLPVLQEFVVAVDGTSDTAIEVDPTTMTIAIGDLLVAPFTTDGGGESLQPPSTDWVKAFSNFGATHTSRCFWKIATQADVDETSYVFTLGSAEQKIAGIMRITGHDPNMPIDSMAVATGTSTTPTCPSITTLTNDCLILRIFGADDDDITTDSGFPAGTTGLWVRDTGTGTATCSQGAAHENQVTAGSTGTAAFTMLLSEPWSAWTIAIRETQADGSDDVQLQHFHYQLPTVTGNHSFTGLNFTPKAIIFFGNTNTAAGAQPDFVLWQGMATALTQRAIAIWGADSAQDTFRSNPNDAACIQIVDPTSEVNVAEASWVSFNSDGFTLNHSIAPPAGLVGHGIAIGGVDAEVFMDTVPANASGVVYNGVGFAFDILFSMSACLAPGAAADQFALQQVGVAARQILQGKDDTVVLHDSLSLCTYNGNNAADQADKHSVLFTDALTGQIFNLARTWFLRLDHVFGDGFACGAVENTDEWTFLAMRIGSLKAKVGSFAKSTAAAPVTQSLPALGFTPQAYGLLSAGKVNENFTPAADASMSIGNLSDRTSLVQGAIGMYDVVSLSAGAEDSSQRQDAGELMNWLGPADALVARAIADPITDDTPSFELDPNDANAYLIGYWAVEEQAGVVNFDGVATSTSNGTASLAVARPLAGVATSVSTGVAALARAVDFSGVAVSTSNGQAALDRNPPLAGVATSVSNATAALARAVAFAGVATSTSAATADLARAVAWEGTAVSVSNGNADTEVVRPLAGVAVATSSASGQFNGNRVLIGGAASNSSDSTGSLVVDRPLAGVATSLSNATADLEVVGVVLFSGVAASVSTAQAQLEVARPLAGVATSVSQATAPLAVTRQIAGSAVSASNATGGLAVTRPVAGVAPSTSQATADVAVARGMAGAAVAVSNGTADLTIVPAILFAGVAVAVSNGLASLFVEVAPLSDVELLSIARSDAPLIIDRHDKPLIGR